MPIVPWGRTDSSVTARERIAEIIVVEGLHDKQAVERVVSADVWYVGGDRIAKEMIDALRRASEHRGVIIFTDPDGPGERIRQRLSAAIPSAKHAFLARRDALASPRASLGVEHATAGAIAEAIAAARPSMAESDDMDGVLFTMADLHEAGLANSADAAQRRAVLGRALRLGYGNAKAFLRKLNALGVTREEWQKALSLLDELRDSQPERNLDP